MARKALLENNKKRKQMAERLSAKRAALKAIIKNKDDSDEAFHEKMKAVMKLSKLPRNSSKVRHRNRCSLSGRPRGYYRDFGISRIALRDLAAFGLLPGVTKSSW